jgi:arsenite methyltransferase
MDGNRDTHQSVQDYYGRLLQSTADLKTSACCLSETLPAQVLAALKHVHDDVKNRFYGCGSPIPPALHGIRVLDLGCGSGRDCYVLAQLVSASGQVIGLDMTAEQLAVARATQAWHAERFGYANTRFLQGYIEDLREIADASIDLVVSNCVINLSPDKPQVFREIFRVLKPGGELYFSDVFSDRRVPAALAQDPVMLGECLGGALYTEDFRRLMAELGCADVRTVSASSLAINNAELERRAGEIRFSSRTVRAFKLTLEDRCEDYGQVATYLGTLPEAAQAFVLDDHHRFVAHKPMLVCGNTADMLAGSRYTAHFRIQGDKARHFGLFDCVAPALGTAAAAGSCC